MMPVDELPVRPLPRDAVPTDTVDLARFLLGKILVRQFPDGELCMGRIVETEAYTVGDPACHAYRGRTRRNRSLFLATGRAYVYLCYGTSYLLNVASEAEGIGAGVLLRALEPMAGIDRMQRERPRVRLPDLTRGPGRLTAALGIDLEHDGIDLWVPGPLWIGADGVTIAALGRSTRIGLTQGADAPLRFFVAGSRYLSGTRNLNVHAH